MSGHILNRLYEVLLSRKSEASDASYVASLYEKGTDKIAAKIIEEAYEFIAEAHFLDANPTDKTIQNNIRAESADLLFHMMTMLAHHNVPFADVCDILDQRFGTSGYKEKASRKQKKERI